MLTQRGDPACHYLHFAPSPAPILGIHSKYFTQLFLCVCVCPLLFCLSDSSLAAALAALLSLLCFPSHFSPQFHN